MAIDGSEMAGLTLMSVEIVCDRRGDLLPNPEQDPIQIIAVSVSQEGSYAPPQRMIILANGEFEPKQFRFSGCFEYRVLRNESELLDAFVSCLCSFDPDIVLAYDLSARASIGYMCVRAYSVYKRNLELELGRIAVSKRGKFGTIITTYLLCCKGKLF